MLEQCSLFSPFIEEAVEDSALQAFAATGPGAGTGAFKWSGIHPSAMAVMIPHRRWVLCIGRYIPACSHEVSKAGLGPKCDYHVSQNVIMNAGGDVGVQTLFDMVKSLVCCSSQPEVLHLLKISKVRALELL